MIRIQIQGGTAVDHGRHLCESCRFQDVLITSRSERRWCHRRDIAITSRVFVCTAYQSKYTEIAGANYQDAYRLVSVPGLGPKFITAGEWVEYENNGILPERFEVAEGAVFSNPRRARARRRANP